MTNGIGSHQSARSQKDEWLTPPWIVNALGPFALDPCAPGLPPWLTAATHYTAVDDGLAKPWGGRVWLNPPYSRNVGEWLAKLAAHGDGIALVFARTETSWFFSEVWQKADALLFIEGRLHFHHLNGSRASANAGAPSVLIAYGRNNAERLQRSTIRGAYVPLQPRNAL